MIATKNLKPTLEHAYVTLMMDIIGRGLVMASQVDPEIHAEVAGFPTDFTICMRVFPKGPQFIAQVQQNRTLKLLPDYKDKPDLTITIKHMHFAFLIFSFQEGTARAFANDRMIADGDLPHAIRLVRCLNKMEALILPKLVANLAVKEYPKDLSLKEKLTTAANIYLKVAQSYIKKGNA